MEKKKKKRELEHGKKIHKKSFIKVTAKLCNIRKICKTRKLERRSKPERNCKRQIKEIE